MNAGKIDAGGLKGHLKSFFLKKKKNHLILNPAPAGSDSETPGA